MIFLTRMSQNPIILPILPVFILSCNIFFSNFASIKPFFHDKFHEKRPVTINPLKTNCQKIINHLTKISQWNKAQKAMAAPLQS